MPEGAKLDSFPVWNLDPDLLHLGPLTIRYYGILFAMGLLLGYYLWRWQMTRARHNQVVSEKWLVWGVVAVLAGSRLGHCLFYEPEIYLRAPWKILEVWKGGLASHGATIGIIAALVGYAWRYGFSVVEVMDRMAMPTCMGAIFVRLGNFMNSEIVGREWWGSLAVRFPRYDRINQEILESRMGKPLGYVVQALPRHPSQLYEATGALVVFLVLLGVDRWLGEKRPRGLMASIFLIGYFSFRFFVELLKEYQTLARMTVDPVARVIHVHGTSVLTMGQWLSVPFVLIGVGFLVYSLKMRLPASMKSAKVD